MQICFNATSKLLGNKAQGLSCFMDTSDCTAFSSASKTFPVHPQMDQDKHPALSEGSDLAQTVSTVLKFNSDKMQSFSAPMTS